MQAWECDSSNRRKNCVDRSTTWLDQLSRPIPTPAPTYPYAFRSIETSNFEPQIYSPRSIALSTGGKFKPASPRYGSFEKKIPEKPQPLDSAATVADELGVFLEPSSQLFASIQGATDLVARKKSAEEASKRFGYHFECSHPLSDGSGRIGMSLDS